MTNAATLEVGPAGDYAPPFAPGPESNPRCYLGIRAGGVSLGRVVFELRADCAPVAAENFRALCAFGVYKGSIIHRVFPDTLVQGGDYHRRCGIVCPPDSPDDCFDLSLVPYQPGGRSIYGDRADGLFADEASGLRHARGTLSMSNPGRPDANGSQWFVTIGDDTAHLDGKYVVFGQVLAGYEIMKALGRVGRKDGTTLQRVVCEDCGELPRGWQPPQARAQGAAVGRGRLRVACAARAPPRSAQRRAPLRCAAGRAMHARAPVLL